MLCHDITIPSLNSFPSVRPLTQPMPMLFRHGGLSRRDAFLLLIGASLMHLWSVIFNGQNQQHQAIFIDAQPQIDRVDHTITNTQIHTRVETETVTQTITAPAAIETPSISSGHLLDTSLSAHAPGWTLFRNLYMSNGTLYLVVPESQRSDFPQIRLMASHPLTAYNTPENIAAREPSELDMTFITPEEAHSRWGDRILTVQGNTVSQVHYPSISSADHLFPPHLGLSSYQTTQNNSYGTIITS